MHVTLISLGITQVSVHSLLDIYMIKIKITIVLHDCIMIKNERFLQVYLSRVSLFEEHSFYLLNDQLPNNPSWYHYQIVSVWEGVYH